MRHKSKKIQINLQQLPTTDRQWKYYMDIAYARLAVIKSPDRESLQILTMAYGMAWRAYKFLTDTHQVVFKALALDAINEVQPELKQPVETFSDVCANCTQSHRCDHLKHDPATRQYFCPILRKFNADQIWKMHNDLLHNRDEKPMDYTRDERRAIAEAWEIPLS